MCIKGNVDTIAIDCIADVLCHGLTVAGDKDVRPERDHGRVNGDHATAHKRSCRRMFAVAGIVRTVRRRRHIDRASAAAAHLRGTLLDDAEGHGVIIRPA